jgi:5-formyltetrahydrofolate cyclo-ligase
VSTVPQDKDQLRKLLLLKRQTLSAGEVEQRSIRIFKQFTTILEPRLSKFETVALYFPIRGEVETRGFFQYFTKKKKRCCFPKVFTNPEQKGQMGFYAVRDWSSLQTGTFGVGEPQPLPGEQPVIPDLILVPAIAFAKDRHRLGYGAGFYDRFFSTQQQQKTLSVGLSYDFQIIESLPTNTHDRPLDFIVSEDGVFP